MEEFKLIVAGSRDFTDYAKAKEEIIRLAEGELAPFAVSIVSGMARGADMCAVQFCRETNVKLYKFVPDWLANGKRAGFLRNREMGTFADGLLAFWDGQSSGTAHMIQFMKRENKPVRVVGFGPMNAKEIAIAVSKLN